MGFSMGSTRRGGDGAGPSRRAAVLFGGGCTDCLNTAENRLEVVNGLKASND
jgi:hypothetical protein